MEYHKMIQKYAPPMGSVKAKMYAFVMRDGREIIVNLQKSVTASGGTIHLSVQDMEHVY